MNRAPINGLVLNGNRWVWVPSSSGWLWLGGTLSGDIWVPASTGHAQLSLSGALSEIVAPAIQGALPSTVALRASLQGMKQSRLAGSQSVVLTSHFFAGKYVPLSGRQSVEIDSEGSLYKHSALQGECFPALLVTLPLSLHHYPLLAPGVITLISRLSLLRGRLLFARPGYLTLRGWQPGQVARTHRPKLYLGLSVKTKGSGRLEIYAVHGASILALKPKATLRSSTHLTLAGKTHMTFYRRAALHVMSVSALSGESRITLFVHTTAGKPALPTQFFEAHYRRRLKVPVQPRVLFVPREQRAWK